MSLGLIRLWSLALVPIGTINKKLDQLFEALRPFLFILKAPLLDRSQQEFAGVVLIPKEKQRATLKCFNWQPRCWIDARGGVGVVLSKGSICGRPCVKTE